MADREMEEGRRQTQSADAIQKREPVDRPASLDIPLSLYIHIPWCVRKCPYCDFNSHETKRALPEADYIDALVDDLKADLNSELVAATTRPIQSVFIGGGTPSLFSARSFMHLFDRLQTHLRFSPDCEITLEANPGTFEQEKFRGFFDAGINRLSIGVQSFEEAKLAQLGRIHGGVEAKRAIQIAQDSGFTRINVDLMHGLPGQSADSAVADIEAALNQGISHLSWYQLTIEPNTHFHKHTPSLPGEDTLLDIQARGLAAIEQHGLTQYEVSAYARPGEESRHNLNYWRFGDYLALGAGAHGKITLGEDILRYQKTRLPEHYLNRVGSRTAQHSLIAPEDRIFEFMMNALRLNRGFTLESFESRTGVPAARLEPTLSQLFEQCLIQQQEQRIFCTTLGRQYLDDVVARFLP